MIRFLAGLLMGALTGYALAAVDYMRAPKPPLRAEWVGPANLVEINPDDLAFLRRVRDARLFSEATAPFTYTVGRVN